MLSSAFDLGEQLTLKTIEYKLHQELWKKYDLSGVDLDFTTWTKIKYLRADGGDLHEDVEKIPNDSGGLYLFFLKCPIITGLTEYPFYIGRAQFTENQNLRKRVKEYFQKFAKDNERPKITKMLKYWGSDLYLAYKTIDENEDIRDYERKIINALLLPMNDEIPEQEIRQAVQAF